MGVGCMWERGKRDECDLIKSQEKGILTSIIFSSYVLQENGLVLDQGQIWLLGEAKLKPSSHQFCCSTEPTTDAFWFQLPCTVIPNLIDSLLLSLLVCQFLGTLDLWPTGRSLSRKGLSSTPSIGVKGRGSTSHCYSKALRLHNWAEAYELTLS